jgi:hypothetical protein
MSLKELQMVDEKKLQLGLIEIFKDFLLGQAELVESIENFGKSFETTAASWQFELPDLYQFCCQHRRELADLEYLQFRQILYRYPTNQMLSRSGGRFELAKDMGHVDRNKYVLKHSGQSV